MLNDPFADLQDIVTDLETVRAVVGDPIGAVLAKVLDHLDDLCRDFIAQSPFIVLGTVGVDGHVDMSPKGDPAGFVRVLDDHRLAIPDRPGNRRLDSFQNILADPSVGIIFMIPGKPETLRVGGKARIVRDQALRENMAVNGKIPDFALVVAVERVFIHCPKCILRSGLWEPERWTEDHLPDVGETMVKHGKLDVTPEQLQAMAVKQGLLDLY